MVAAVPAAEVAPVAIADVGAPDDALPALAFSGSSFCWSGMMN